MEYRPRYTIYIKQPGLAWRELCGALYLRWAKDAAEDHARHQPWGSTEYYIYSNRAGYVWVGRVKDKQLEWRRLLCLAET